MKSFDVKLADRAYMFGRSPGITLGAALIEPGKPSEVGSVVIESFHAGIGRAFADGILRYSESLDADLTIPGEFRPAFALASVGSFTATGVVASRPTFGYGNGASGTVYVIAGQTLRAFDPAAPGSGLSTPTQAGDAFEANTEYSGSVFQYNDELIFGIIENGAGGTSRGKPAAYAKSDLVAAPGTVTRVASLGISYGASTRGRCFWVDIDTGLRWAPQINGATFKGGGTYTEFPSTGNGIELGKPRTTWLSMLGSSLLMSRADGVLIGANEQGLLREAGRVPTGGLDYHFGRRAFNFHDGMLVPSQQGVWSFDLRTLTLRPASPNYVQGQPDERLRGEVTAVGSAGPYGFIAIKQGSTPTSTGFEVVRYQDRMAVHDLIPTTASNVVITDLLPFYDSATRQTLLYYIEHNISTQAVAVKYRPLRLPADQGSGLTVSNPATVDVPRMAGPSPATSMTKFWVQVRGHFDKGTGGSAQLQFANFAVDGDAITIDPVTATGPFVRTLEASAQGNRLGREITAGTLSLVNPVFDTQMSFPLTFDFVWVPGVTDAAVLSVLVSGEVTGRVASIRGSSPMGTTEELLALRNTITTLDFGNAEATAWTVLVEDVQLISSENEDQPNGEQVRVAQVHLRRLT